MDIIKTYVKVSNPSHNCTHIKISVHYSLGGMNYFSCRSEKRGYYLSIQPVEISEHFESFTGFSGIKHLVLEVARQGKKNEAMAISTANNIVKSILQSFCEREGIVLEESYENISL